MNDPESFIEDLIQNHPKKAKVLDQLIKHHFRYKRSFPSQSTLARYVGCSREWVNRCIKQFVQWGLLYKIRRYDDSCVYFVSHFLCTMDMIHRLKYLLDGCMQVVRRLSLHVTLLYILGNKDFKIFRSKTNIFSNAFVRKYTFDEKVESVLANIREKLGLGEVVKPDDTLSPAIQSLSKLGFSIEERVRLSRFSEKTILEVKRLLLQAKNVQNRMGWFYAMCKKLSDRENISASLQLRSVLFEGNDLNVELVSPVKEQPIGHCPIMGVEQNIPQTGIRKIPSFERITLEAKQEEDWQKKCNTEYERIALENARKPSSTPLWLLSNPYEGRVSEECKDSVLAKVALVRKEMQLDLP